MTTRTNGAGGRRAGVTLLELLLVLAILAVVLGGGLGVFAALDVGKRQAVGLVKSMLRSAQNAAIATQSPARVRLDPAAGTIVADSLRVVGTWHFEDRSLAGAFQLDGGERGCTFAADGYLGHALSFGGPGAFAEVQVKHDPSWDFRAGFAVDLAVRRHGTGGGRLVRIGRTIGLEIGGQGEARGWFLARAEKDGQPMAGGKVFVQSDPGAVPLQRWTRLRLEYDHQRLALFVDGVAVQAREETAEVWKVEDSLVLSDPDRPFPGGVDHLVVSALVSSEVAILPETVRFTGDAPRQVLFAAGGTLDRRAHPDPVFVTLEFEDGARESVAVGLYGTVE
ncbi:MAG: prepilin-type N-terminal cleavage/methylation domain-containing protein [Planctomycetota bacterium]